MIKSSKKLNIALLAPVFEPVPPKGWGGVEFVVYGLAQGLIKDGHDVTLFCSEQSKVAGARIVTNGLPPANHDKKQDYEKSQKILDAKFLAMQNEFDIVHAHTSHRFLYLENQLEIPHVLTVHTMFYGKWRKMYLPHSKMPIVNISKSQAEVSGLKLNFVGPVYNGVDLKDYEVGTGHGGYNAWLGRIVRKKGLLDAIEISKRADIKLKFAGRFITDIADDVDNVKQVKKKMHDPLIEYIGEVSDRKKSSFLAGAKCFINPIQWEEPFGLVVPEANACGTPVVAFALGAMPELIKDGINGYLVKPGDINGMVKAIKRIYDMPEAEYQKMRKACRKHVEDNFTVERMVDGYEEVYKKIIK